MKQGSTKALIVSTAVRLFSQRGYYNVPIRDIAKEMGITPGALYNHFDSKEDILSETLQTAKHFLSHLQYSRDEIVDMLQTRSPREILKDFVTYYRDEDDTERMAIYRLLYMEMYNHRCILEFVYEHFIKQPAENLRNAIDVMIGENAIPSGDSMAIAELWNRTSVVYGYIAAHDHSMVKMDEYQAMTDFFIDMAVGGVPIIPVDSIEEVRPPANPFTDYQGTPSTTMELILHKSLDLFSKYGYATVGVRQIAEASGIKAGSLYNHFAGKEALMQAIVGTFLTGVRKLRVADEDFTAALQSRNYEKIIYILSTFTRSAGNADDYKVYRVLFREQYANSFLGQVFLDTIASDKQLFVKVCREMEIKGKVPADDIWKISVAYVHTMWSLSIGVTTDIRLVDEEMLRPRTAALLVSLLANGYLRA